MSSTNNPNELLFSGFSKSSSDDRTSNPKTNEILSDFGDGSCGEPLFSQHLLIDFTPNTAMDNDIVQKKVCEFWECINKATHIQNLMVKPEKNNYARLSPRDCIESLKFSREKRDVEKTAVATLEFAKEEGLIDRTFEMNLPHSICTISGSREYEEYVPEVMLKDKKRRLTTTSVCSCTEICTTCPGVVKSGTPRETLTPAKRLCKTMDNWDSKHPKKTRTTDGTSNARSCEKFSVFGDGSCGEPLLAQHLNLDFTPNEDIDNDFVQRKICSFWKFIENTPEIHNLMVKPEIESFLDSSSTQIISETETMKFEAGYSKVVDSPAEKTAVDMLEVVGEKLIGRTLEGKLPQSHCTLGSREYKEMETFTQQKKNNKNPPVCYCTKICSPTCPNHLRKVGKAPAENLSTLNKLSRTLKEWDAEHPKSMEPPGHPLSLQNCILQRQVFP